MRIEGKRHSRVHVYSREENTPGGKIIPWTWAWELGEIRNRFAAVLRRCGLPGAPFIWFTAAGKKAWQAERPKSMKHGSCALARYVRDLGYQRDSPEELAARIIEEVEQIENHQIGPDGSATYSGRSGAALPRRPDLALSMAVELGRLITLYEVYAADAKGPSKGGSRSAMARKHEKQRRTLAVRSAALTLLATNPALSNNRIAEILAERGHGGKEAIKKMLPKRPKRREG